MTYVTVEKNLIIQQDIAFGENSLTQTRGGGSFTVDQVRCIYPVNSLEELNSVDPVKFPKAILFSGNNSYLYVNVSGSWVEQDKNIASWDEISTITPTAAGQLFTLAQHTSGGIGGGTLMAFAGSVTDDGGMQKNCLGGFYLKRINYDYVTPQMFGVINSGNETARAQLWANYITANGGVAKFQRGEYVIDDLDLSYVSGKNYKLIGDGPESTTILPPTIGNYGIDLNGSSGTIFSNVEVSDFMMFMQAGRNGLKLFGNSYLDAHNLTFYGGNVGVTVESVLSSSFRRCAFYGAVIGIETLIGAGFSGHNAMQYDKCDWTQNTYRGMSGGPANVISITNGQCQFNGSMADSNSGGIALQFNSAINECGLTMSNMYFEYNKGGFDLSLNNSGVGVVTHTITNCQFFRYGATDFVQHNIFATGKTRLILIGCTFGSFGGYVPSGARGYLSVTSDVEVICIGCNFQSITEQGTYRNAQLMDQNMVVCDQKATGVTAGASLAATQDRTLNTVRYNTIPGASLAANTITLPAGIYKFRAKAPGYACNATQLMLFNGAAFVNIGSSEVLTAGGATFIDDIITITTTTNYKVAQYCATAIADGLGKPANSGQVEVYTMVSVERLAVL